MADKARKPTKFAKPADVRRALGTMPAEFVHCRNYGHVWAHRTVTMVGRDYEQTLGCQSCHTEKVQVIDRNGNIMSSTTYYAEGYVLVGLGRLSADTRRIVRVASLEAFLAGQSDATTQR